MTVSKTGTITFRYNYRLNGRRETLTPGRYGPSGISLALAERHGHAWFSHLSLDGVDLGRGKRSLVSGGRLHPRYQITLPGDLDEQLG